MSIYVINLQSIVKFHEKELDSLLFFNIFRMNQSMHILIVIILILSILCINVDCFRFPSASFKTTLNKNNQITAKSFQLAAGGGS